MNFPRSSASVQIIYNKKFPFRYTNIGLHLSTDEKTVLWHPISSAVPVYCSAELYGSALLESSARVTWTDQQATASATPKF